MNITTLAFPQSRTIVKFLCMRLYGFFPEVCMDAICLNPVGEELTYQGLFAGPAFELLGTPIPLYRNLLNRLRPYGATFKDLSVNVATLSEANLRCTLLALGTSIVLHLDRLDVNFVRVHETGKETAYQIIRDCWTAIHETEGSIVLTEHILLANVVADIQDTSYAELMRRYVTTPSTLSGKAHAGVVFYMQEDLASGERQGHVVIDRLAGQERRLILRISATFDAQKVPMDILAQRVDTYMKQSLDYLGLALENGR